jgi:hypothetical protein
MTVLYIVLKFRNYNYLPIEQFPVNELKSYIRKISPQLSEKVSKFWTSIEIITETWNRPRMEQSLLIVFFLNCWRCL